MHETRVWPLGWEDPLEKGLATHSSILAWRIPWTEEPDELQSMRLQRQTQLKWFSMHASCNPGEIWQAANSRLWCGDGGKWIDSKYILITYNRKKSQKGHHIYIYVYIYIYIYMYVSLCYAWNIFNQLYFKFFFIHSTIEGHLGCFYVSAFVKSTAMNTGVHISSGDLLLLFHVSFWIRIFSWYMSRSGLVWIIR